MITQVFIHTTCPHCGAPLEFPTGTWTMMCPYCSTPLRIIGRGRSLRFVLADSLDPRTAVTAVERHLRRRSAPLPGFGVRTRRRWVPFWLVTGRFYAWLYGVVSRSTPSRQPHASSARFFLQTYARPQLDKPVEHPVPVPRRRLIVKEVNHSFAACAARVEPSLGIRTQALHLSVFDRAQLESAGDEVVPVNTTREQAMQRAMKATEFTLYNRGIAAQQAVWRMVGEELSLVYQPQWLVSYSSSDGDKTAIVDGIAGRVERIVDESEVPSVPRPDEPLAVEVMGVLPHRCPYCGWDLPVIAKAAAFPCTNCDRLWWEHEEKLSQPKHTVAHSRIPPDKLLPFWVFVVRLMSPPAIVASQSQWVRLCPGALRITGDPSRPVRIFVPAFVMAVGESAVKLGSSLTTMQPEYATDRDTPAHAGDACVLPVEEAAELAEVVFLGALADLVRKPAFFASLNPDLSSPELVWVPFVRDDIYLRDELVGATIESRGVGDAPVPR
jgi:predicted RNA-binding Zn-ribbon protein involved in translation (DUF1610 family)